MIGSASPTCPICTAPAPTLRAGTPYHVCPSCSCWFQTPPPSKTYEADHEQPGHLMSEADREVNRSLAGLLARRFEDRAEKRSLDVGSKYPFLASCLKSLGFDAYGVEGIDSAEEYGHELGVPMVLADFEATPAGVLLEKIGGRVDLITMVHVFEHMYQPLDALRKLRALVADDGLVFLRLPSHDVPGFERDLTPGHFTIHPFFHCAESLLEALVQTRDLFVIEETYPIQPGQRDVLLRPARRVPQVAAGMIVKNEERDLPRLLRSIESVVDEVAIVDTGSTDRTFEVARETIDPRKLLMTIYTDASEQDNQGDWKLYDFARARNVAVGMVETLDVDWFLWVDADDELLTPEKVRRASYRYDKHVVAMMVESGSSRWEQHRMWRTKLGIRFEGVCHEYPTHGGHASLEMHDCVVRHNAEPGGGETSNARNLRILQRAYDRGDRSPRTLFYLAQTHHHGGRFIEAVRLYDERIRAGVGFWDEWVFAHLYKARCQRAAKDIPGAESTLLLGLSHAPGWGEFWMELAYIMYDACKYERAIGLCMQSLDQPEPATALWRESNKYTDQPARLISWSYEHLGEDARALEWAKIARDRIEGNDREWDARIERLSSPSEGRKVRRITEAAKTSIGLIRPGAIGDVLMTLNLLPLLRTKHPGRRIVYYCHPTIGDALRELLYQAGVDEILSSDRHASLPHEEAINLIGYPLHEGYPDVPMRRHLLEYFGEEMGLSVSAEQLPTLELPRPKRPVGAPERYVTLQVKTGWSVYKEWPIERWGTVVEALPEIRFVQIGRADEPRIPGANHAFMGTSISTAIALVANARLHVGLDSFANHLTHYLWSSQGQDGQTTSSRTKGVILWGSTQPSASGYTENVNIRLGLPCQPCFREDPTISRVPRGVCPHPVGQTYAEPKHACMSGVSVDVVVDAILRSWGDRDERRLPVVS